jgi:hypothetical protein
MVEMVPRIVETKDGPVTSNYLRYYHLETYSSRTYAGTSYAIGTRCL